MVHVARWLPFLRKLDKAPEQLAKIGGEVPLPKAEGATASGQPSSVRESDRERRGKNRDCPGFAMDCFFGWLRLAGRPETIATRLPLHFPFHRITSSSGGLTCRNCTSSRRS